MALGYSLDIAVTGQGPPSAIFNISQNFTSSNSFPQEDKSMKIHFIGIGGIGVSALASYYLAQHYSVSGSDLASSEITDSLRLRGDG